MRFTDRRLEALWQQTTYSHFRLTDRVVLCGFLVAVVGSATTALSHAGAIRLATPHEAEARDAAGARLAKGRREHVCEPMVTLERHVTFTSFMSALLSRDAGLLTGAIGMQARCCAAQGSSQPQS